MDHYSPLVSILVPVYNVSKFLRICIDSIVRQTYSRLQVVLINDGSKDDSLEICKEYADIDNRIEVYTQENMGVATTRNRLLDKANGDYILFIDADDWLELDMVEHLVSVSVEYNADISMCDRLINDTSAVSCESIIRVLDHKQSIVDFLEHQYFDGSLCNKLIKKNLLCNISFQPGITYGEDALFVWNLLMHINKIAVTSKQLYHYRMNINSLSHTYTGHQFSAFYVWDKISSDVSISYPSYTILSMSQFCNQMVVILYDAAKHGYKYDINVEKLSLVIKKNKKYLLKTGHSIMKYLFACLICRHYKFISKLLYRN